MTTLSVNVNKLATLRNSRGKNNPDVLKTTLDIIAYGAQGITVHPRPDGRHIRQADVYAIANAIDVELNIEGYPDPDFLALVTAVKPAQCTLVPDPPHALTSNAGWNVETQFGLLKKVVAKLQDEGIRTSLFVSPFDFSPHDIDRLLSIGTNRVELYTEAYADAYDTPNGEKILSVYKEMAEAMRNVGIGVNAGHDLGLLNLKHFIETIPFIEEVSIGHALICDALYFGLQDTIQKYLACLKTESP